MHVIVQYANKADGWHSVVGLKSTKTNQKTFEMQSWSRGLVASFTTANPDYLF